MKDKQTEELVHIMCYNEDGRICDTFPCEECPLNNLAEILYNAGYRKASEVAREIFNEIGKLIEPNGTYLWRFDLIRLAELKKKYTE